MKIIISVERSIWKFWSKILLKTFLNFHFNFYYTLSIRCIALYKAMSNQRGTALLNHKWLLNISVVRSELNISLPYLLLSFKVRFYQDFMTKSDILSSIYKDKINHVCETHFEKAWRARYSSKRLVPLVKLSLVKSVSLSAPQSSVNTTCLSPDAASSTILLINIVSYKKKRKIC